MPNVQQFQQGAQVLQQVDVSEIFISLAMGIADAQAKLDDNSIAQIVKLAQTKVGDKSLLELGFMPAFYAFQHADISASIHLRMALKESISIGAQATFNLAKSKGFSDKEARFASSNDYKSLMQDYKSSRSFSFKAGKKTSVRIFDREYQYEIKNDFRKALRELREDISRHEKIDLVIQEILAQDLKIISATGLYVWIDRGLLRVQERLDFKPGSTIGILRLKDLGSTDTFDLDGNDNNNSFSNKSNFKDLVSDAKSANGVGTVYGISKDGKFYCFDSSDNIIEVPTEMYFRFNDFEILYDENLKYGRDQEDLVINIGSTPFTNKNHPYHSLFHQCLRLIHEKDPESIFTITGYTDPVGGKNQTNELLARKRAESLRSHIFNKPHSDNIIIKTSTSENGGSDLRLRKAEIGLKHHYIIFIGGKIKANASPESTAQSPNKFIWTHTINDNPDKFSLEIEYDGNKININDENNITDVINKIKKSDFAHSSESVQDVHYLLHDEAVVKMSLFSEKEEISEMENAVTETQEENVSESAAIVSEERSQLSSAFSQLGQKAGMQTFGLGVSVDFRFARQFEMEVSGNASMSARMVALPPPEGFRLYIQSLYE